MGSGSPAHAAHSCSLSCPSSDTLPILGGLSRDSINIRDTAGFEFLEKTLVNKIPQHIICTLHCVFATPSQAAID